MKKLKIVSTLAAIFGLGGCGLPAQWIAPAVGVGGAAAVLGYHEIHKSVEQNAANDDARKTCDGIIKDADNIIAITSNDGDLRKNADKLKSVKSALDNVYGQPRDESCITLKDDNGISYKDSLDQRSKSLTQREDRLQKLLDDDEARQEAKEKKQHEKDIKDMSAFAKRNGYKGFIDANGISGFLRETMENPGEIQKSIGKILEVNPQMDTTFYVFQVMPPDLKAQTSGAIMGGAMLESGLPPSAFGIYDNAGSPVIFVYDTKSSFVKGESLLTMLQQRNSYYLVFDGIEDYEGIDGGAHQRYTFYIADITKK